ncbi:exodeoxyribonuclease III [Sulfurovum sp. NBC37-1]|uniref:exodeoxyribonuclease III n=1 Tax=Sulfurovum sp. (strain NBC37-1) TaxID=387093 RepID=UPI0001587722|nr:exodeoxyribonuclease III [Sulfurovum sp. NBC37-1]BAF71603.1 exodeoxyribonuclease III [Sulfurovum sp. NBC37-1]
MAKTTFISWNVNGIRAVEKKNALKWIDESDIDFLGLQEIKAEADQIPDSIFEKHYKFQSINSSSRKGQSGVALFTNIKGTASGGDHIDILNEGRINEYHFGSYVLFNVYFPNGQRSEERLAYKLAFYERFLAYINEVRTEGKSIIICGDVNTAHKEIDLARPKSNENTSGFLPVERAWMDKLLDNGYIDTFRYIHGDEPDRYSWWSYRTKARERNVGWRIDYFFVSDDLKEKIVDADILDHIMGSDHCPVKLVLDI